MKHVLKCLPLIVSFSAIAQREVTPVSSKHVAVTGSKAILVRTNETPDMVRLVFKMSIPQKVCKATALQTVTKTSATECGSDSKEVRVQRGRNRYETVTREFPRTCQVKQTVCVSEAIELSEEFDTVRVIFRDLPALGDGETDKFVVTAHAQSVETPDFRFSVKPLATALPYRVHQVRFLGLVAVDRFEVVVK